MGRQIKIYPVGGYVRDKYLGIVSQDIDYVVVGATPEDMQAQGFYAVGTDFPVYLHPKKKGEFALARQERKQGKGYKGFSFNTRQVSLEEDLMRRDLTINAMAEDENGQLIDPYGGHKDLQNRILRHVSPAFTEDPLRVLRVARFMAQLAEFNFRLAPETRQLMEHMVTSGELAELTPERVWLEFSKAFQTTRPGLFMAVLHQIGALRVLAPEWDKLYHTPQNPKHHPEGDVGTHTQMVMDQAAQKTTDQSTRLRYVTAAFAHDVGKGHTPEKHLPHHPGHEKAGLPLVKAWAKNYRLPKNLSQFALVVTELHGEIHQGQDHNNAQRHYTVLQKTQAWRNPQTFYDLLELAEADHLGRLGFENCPYPQKPFWHKILQVCAKVTPQPLMEAGFQGPALGKAIEKARIEAIDQFLQGRRHD